MRWLAAAAASKSFGDVPRRQLVRLRGRAGAQHERVEAPGLAEAEPARGRRVDPVDVRDAFSARNADSASSRTCLPGLAESVSVPSRT